MAAIVNGFVKRVLQCISETDYFTRLKIVAPQIEGRRSQIDDSEFQIETSIPQTDDCKCQIKESQSQIKNTQFQIENTPSHVDDSQSQFEDTLSQIDAVQSQIDASQSLIKDTPSQIDDSPSPMEEGIHDTNGAYSGCEDVDENLEDIPLSAEDHKVKSPQKNPKKRPPKSPPKRAQRDPTSRDGHKAPGDSSTREKGMEAKQFWKSLQQPVVYRLEKIDNRVIKTVHCPNCLKWTWSRNYMRHFRKCSNKPTKAVSCLQCDESFSFKYQLAKHLKEVHDQLKDKKLHKEEETATEAASTTPVSCPVCHVTSLDTSMKSHLSQHLTYQVSTGQIVTRDGRDWGALLHQPQQAQLPLLSSSLSLKQDESGGLDINPSTAGLCVNIETEAPAKDVDSNVEKKIAPESLDNNADRPESPGKDLILNLSKEAAFGRLETGCADDASRRKEFRFNEDSMPSRGVGFNVSNAISAKEPGHILNKRSSAEDISGIPMSQAETKHLSFDVMNQQPAGEINHHQSVKEAVDDQPDKKSIEYFSGLINFDDFAFSCLVCNVRFMAYSELSSHKKEVHKKDKRVIFSASKTECRFHNLVCDLCGKSFEQTFAFLEHMRMHRGVYKCNICHLELSNSNSFKKHMRLHSRKEGDQPFVCETCGKGFWYKHGLEHHQMTRHGGKKRVSRCGTCGEEFTSQSLHAKHLRLHHNQAKHLSCDICGDLFSRERALKTHKVVVHLAPKTTSASTQDGVSISTAGKEQLYACNVCGKTFPSRPLLKSHSFVHTDVRPFQCGVCQKRFKRKMSLWSHKSVHTGVKPFKCDICFKTFRRKSYLQLHVSLHTGVKEHACPVCGRAFRLKGDRDQHWKRHSVKD